MSKIGVLFICLIFQSVRASNSTLSEYNNVEDVERYLYNYGYLSSEKETHSHKEVTEALRQFQETFHLTQTGYIDPSTLAVINTPRCHESDELKKIKPTMRKFSVRVQDAPNIHGGIAPLLRQAFQLWRNGSDVIFFNSKRNSKADITVSFRSNEIYYPTGRFDILLATSPPNPLQVIISDEAPYFVQPVNNRSRHQNGSDLLRVLAHGIGHSLGFSHSFQRDSIMNPLFPIVNSQEPLSLNDKDYALLIELYGHPRQKSYKEVKNKEQRLKTTLRSCGNARSLQVHSIVASLLAWLWTITSM